MKRLALTVFTLALSFTGGVWLHADEAPSDKDKLQGTWRMVSRETRGEARDHDGQVVFKGDRFQMLRNGEVRIEVTFKLDPSARPKTIDIHVEKSPEESHVEKKTSLGIYELLGDELRWCADEPGHEKRPTEFSGAGEGHMFVVLAREKAPAK
jgi:uncharacterized protein (TIGR03067 family)